MAGPMTQLGVPVRPPSPVLGLLCIAEQQGELEEVVARALPEALHCQALVVVQRQQLARQLRPAAGIARSDAADLHVEVGHAQSPAIALAVALAAGRAVAR